MTYTKKMPLLAEPQYDVKELPKEVMAAFEHVTSLEEAYRLGQLVGIARACRVANLTPSKTKIWLDEGAEFISLVNELHPRGVDVERYQSYMAIEPLMQSDTDEGGTLEFVWGDTLTKFRCDDQSSSLASWESLTTPTKEMIDSLEKWFEETFGPSIRKLDKDVGRIKLAKRSEIWSMEPHAKAEMDLLIQKNGKWIEPNHTQTYKVKFTIKLIMSRDVASMAILAFPDYFQK